MDEFKIIANFVKTKPDDSIVLGVGDDCAIIEHNETHYRITTSDALVEHKHFRLQDLSFKELGYKSLAVNLSDISAMGGVAKWCQLTLALPSTVSEEHVEQFFKGFYELSEQENISLVGGDLSSSERDIFINITLSGLVEKDKIKKRADFKKGEILCVTGTLGDSAAGLRCLLSVKEEKELIQKHIRPQIYHKEGQWLSQQSSVQGMMDLSDGLLSDLERIDCGVEIELTQLPLSKDLISACKKYDWNPEELALAGGEDYVLLFSCKEETLSSLKESYKKEFQTEIFVIGRVNSKSSKKIFLRNNEAIEISYKPFTHFKS